MTLPSYPWVKEVVVEDGGVTAQLHNDSCSRVKEASALLAPKKRLWGCASARPRRALHASCCREFPGKPSVCTAGAHELPVECVIYSLRWRNFVLIAFNRQAGSDRIKRFNDTMGVHERAESSVFRGRHTERLAPVDPAVSMSFGQTDAEVL